MTVAYVGIHIPRRLMISKSPTRYITLTGHLMTMLTAIVVTLSFSISSIASEARASEPDIPRLENPFDVAYLQNQLKSTKPRLIYNDEILNNLKSRLQTDAIIKNVYKAIRNEAGEILSKPLIERQQTSFDMLDVSRGFLRRMNVLGLVYLVEKDRTMLDRINSELLAISAFEDWNAAVFLDTGEICMGVAIALDWTVDDLPQETIEIAKEALIEKGLKPSWKNHGGNPKHIWWIGHYNNWNQVCNGGLIAAAISVADLEPELAAMTIHRAMDSIPHVLNENYNPDGACPEGVMYWHYTTSYAVLTISMLETSFGADFGYRDYPGFMESALFKVMTSNLPCGGYYNYGDCVDGPHYDGDMILAWFAKETGKSMFFEKDKFLIPAKSLRLSYLAGASLAWISRYRETDASKPPSSFVAEGNSPVAVFRDHGDPNGFYLGSKGGCGAVSHGNMDAGSFLFELDGVRWSLDPGTQSYHIGEQGFDLWKQHQESQRWELLTKNNMGHSTLTIDGKRHVVDGYALVSCSQTGKNPSVTYDLSPSLEGQLQSALRTFTRQGERTLRIVDHLVPLPSTQQITWQLITQAEVTLDLDGAVLRQDGKTLLIRKHSPSQVAFEIVPLDPPPHRYDKHIKGLKRIELRVPVTGKEPKITLDIELRGQPE